MKNDPALWFPQLRIRYIEYLLDVYRILVINMFSIRHLNEGSKDGVKFRNIGMSNGKEVVLHELDFTPFIENEIKNDFPINCSHSIIAIWSALEQFVNDCAIYFMINFPDILTNSSLARIKVRIADYEKLDDYSKMEYILRVANYDTRYGIDRFEEIFQQLNISDKIDNTLRNQLVELCQIRNVLVHNGGIVDNKFLDSCAWNTDYQKGDKLQLKFEVYMEYAFASESYVDVIEKRIMGKSKMPKKTSE